MRKSLKNLLRFTMSTVDGTVGRIVDCSLDDEQWAVRYFVVETGAWLAGRKILISPIALQEVDWKKKRMKILLNRTTIANSPDVYSEAPLSRKTEEALSRYYQWPVYWQGIGLWGRGMGPTFLMYESFSNHDDRDAESELDNVYHQIYASELLKYQVRTEEGEIGSVEDFLFDQNSWKLEMMIITTISSFSGKRFVAEFQHADHLDRETKNLYITLSRDWVRESLHLSEGGTA